MNCLRRDRRSFGQCDRKVCLETIDIFGGYIMEGRMPVGIRYRTETVHLSFRTIEIHNIERFTGGGECRIVFNPDVDRFNLFRNRDIDVLGNSGHFVTGIIMISLRLKDRCDVGINTAVTLQVSVDCQILVSQCGNICRCNIKEMYFSVIIGHGTVVIERSLHRIDQVKCNPLILHHFIPIPQ